MKIKYKKLLLYLFLFFFVFFPHLYFLSDFHFINYFQSTLNYVFQDNRSFGVSFFMLIGLFLLLIALVFTSVCLFLLCYFALKSCYTKK